MVGPTLLLRLLKASRAEASREAGHGALEALLHAADAGLNSWQLKDTKVMWKMA